MMTDELMIWDNRLCGRVTKTGKRCRAHATLGDHGQHIGCYLHDPRRETHRDKGPAAGRVQRQDQGSSTARAPVQAGGAGRSNGMPRRRSQAC
jgi:hypothetical protein